MIQVHTWTCAQTQTHPIQQFIRAKSWRQTNFMFFPLCSLILFGRLLIITLMPIFFFILYLFVRSIIRSTWQCGTVQIMVGKRHKTMFLWSAYMNNEKTFVIEILVLRALSRLLMMMIIFLLLHRSRFIQTSTIPVHFFGRILYVAATLLPLWNYFFYILA